MCGRIKMYEKVIIYGAGNRGRDLYSKINSCYLDKKVYLVDSNYKALRTKITEVKSLAEVVLLDNKCFIISNTNGKAIEEITKELIISGIDKETIYCI